MLFRNLNYQKEALNISTSKRDKIYLIKGEFIVSLSTSKLSFRKKHESIKIIRFTLIVFVLDESYYHLYI